MRRGSPELIVAALIALLLGSILWYTHHVVGGLRLEAQRSSRNSFLGLLEPFQQLQTAFGSRR